MTPRQIIFAILILVVAGTVFFLIAISREEGQPEENFPPDLIERISGEPDRKIIGTSVEGREIEVLTFGEGNRNLLFVGTIHGGYEWNSALLAYQMVDYLEENPEIIPDDLEVSIIPVLNPDGLFKIVGTSNRFAVSMALSVEETAEGRFNANGVDLNRNFDCNWQPESSWRGQVVSAGDEPFSEPEARAVRDFILETEPEAVIFWHSAAGAVFGSECNEGILPETVDIMNAYAEAAGYRAVPSFDHYEISGDAEGWLAKIGIPSVTVELETHQTVEWQQNLAGVKALFEYYNLAK